MAARYSAFAVLVVFGVLACTVGVFSQSCQPDFKALDEECGLYVVKGGPQSTPSEGCCAVVKRADLPCICSLITKEIQVLIDVQKVKYVAQTCGKPIPAGTKCGGITI